MKKLYGLAGVEFSSATYENSLLKMLNNKQILI